MKTKITEKILSDWHDAKKLADSLEDQITNRIDYILRFLYKTFDGELDYWYFNGAGEGEVGDLSKYIGDIEIYGFVFESVKDPDEIEITDKYGKYFCLHDGNRIPTRWLCEDFEQEVLDGIKSFKKQEAERLTKKKELDDKKKAKKQLLAESAKKKLTKEELAALKSVL